MSAGVTELGCCLELGSGVTSATDGGGGDETGVDSVTGGAELGGGGGGGVSLGM